MPSPGRLIVQKIILRNMTLCNAKQENRYVNPIALTAITWRYFAVYVGWIAFEALCVYFLYPETQGRTLEELAFRKQSFPSGRAPSLLKKGSNFMA
jgi:hypothetical protein